MLCPHYDREGTEGMILLETGPTGIELRINQVGCAPVVLAGAITTSSDCHSNEWS